MKDVIEIRGFANQEIEKTMLLLLEEVGELAKSIRKNATDMGIDNNKANHCDTVESEVADVFIVLCSVCNKLDIDLYKALKEKDESNIDIWCPYCGLNGQIYASKDFDVFDGNLKRLINYIDKNSIISEFINSCKNDEETFDIGS